MGYEIIGLNVPCLGPDGQLRFMKNPPNVDVIKLIDPDRPKAPGRETVICSFCINGICTIAADSRVPTEGKAKRGNKKIELHRRRRSDRNTVGCIYPKCMSPEQWAGLKRRASGI